MKAYLSLIAIDLKLAARLRAVIFFNYLFPLLFFFIFATVFSANKSQGIITYVMTMSISLGILGNGLFGAGMRAIQEREMNILRRYKVTPITPMPLLLASMVTGLVIFMPYILLVLTLAHFLYHMPWPDHFGYLVAFIALGLISFRAIGLVIASVANNMQEGTILVQLFYFPMLFLSGATIPVETFPRFVQVISQFIPATYLVRGIRGILYSDSGFMNSWWKAVLALILTAVVGAFVGMKLFRWEKEEKISGRAKMWIAAVLLPFIVLGAWQVYHNDIPAPPNVFGH